MKKVLVLWFSLLILVFILSGCVSNTTTPASSAPATTSASTPAAATPQFGGTLLLFTFSDPQSAWPPSMTGQTDGQYSSLALETLFRFDKQGNMVPLLATDYKADQVAKTITVSLRKGVKFQDGSDFNAQVCKWNLEQYNAGGKPELKRVSSIDVVDDYTIRLNLSNFDNTIITNLANCSDAGRMISKQSFDANGGKDWAVNHPVGTGPFQLVSWTKTVGLTWKRFDGYWGGKPYLDGVQMKEYANQTAAMLDFEAGNLNTFRPIPQDAKKLQADGKYNVVNMLEGQVPALAGYANDPASPFSKLEVRQALSYAINTKEMCDSFGLGFWTPQTQWAVPGTWGYNTDVKGYPYNPAKAKELLAAAGYPSGFKTSLSFWNMTPIYMDECSTMQNYLKAVNIDVTLNPLQRPGFADMASFGKGWNGICRMQGFSNPDPLIKLAGVMSGTEFAGVVLPQEIKDAYNAAVTAPDFATKQKLTWQLMSLITDKYCMATYLYIQPQPTVKTKNMHDDEYGELPYLYLSPKTWLSK